RPALRGQHGQTVGLCGAVLRHARLAVDRHARRRIQAVLATGGHVRHQAAAEGLDAGLAHAHAAVAVDRHAEAVVVLEVQDAVARLRALLLIVDGIRLVADRLPLRTRDSLVTFAARTGGPARNR